MQNTNQENKSYPINQDFILGKKLEGGIKLSTVTNFKPAGDQPKAIKKLILGVKNKSNENRKTCLRRVLFVLRFLPRSVNYFVERFLFFVEIVHEKRKLSFNRILRLISRSVNYFFGLRFSREL